jgi:Metallo-peptidase family M12/IPT/TIG domain
MQFSSMRTLVAATLLTSAVGAQAVPVLDEVRSHFGLRSATIQSLSLPQKIGLGFGVQVRLGKDIVTLALTPYDIRAAGFKLWIDDGKRLRTATPTWSRTLRGTVRGVTGSRVAASLDGGQLTAAVHLPGATWWIEPISNMTGTPSAYHVVYHNRAVLDRGRRCGNDQVPVDIRVATANAGSCLRVADIAIDADFAYYSRNGKNTKTVQTRVNAIMNLVDVIYQRDVNVAFKISALIIRTTRLYTGTTNSQVLTEFANQWRNNHKNVPRDLAHRFTSVSTGNIVGTAYVSVVCGGSAYAFSRASYGSTATAAGLVSHEIGHNFGAGHCNSKAPCYIMCSTLGSCNRSLAKFGPFAIGAINTFQSNLTCLSQPVAKAAPVLSDIQPNSVRAFPQQQVTIKGTEMFGLQKVWIGGKSASFRCVDATTAIATVPKGLDLALHKVQLQNAKGTSNLLNLNVTGAHPSVTDVSFLMTRNASTTLAVHTDRGWNAMLLISTSIKPSVSPGFFSLSIGNGFTELVLVNTLPADKTGRASMTLTIPGSIPVNSVAYWQAITWDPSKPFAYPLEVSNVSVSIVNK